MPAHRNFGLKKHDSDLLADDRDGRKPADNISEETHSLQMEGFDAGIPCDNAALATKSQR